MLISLTRLKSVEEVLENALDHVGCEYDRVPLNPSLFGRVTALFGTIKHMPEEETREMMMTWRVCQKKCVPSGRERRVSKKRSCLDGSSKE